MCTLLNKQYIAMRLSLPPIFSRILLRKTLIAPLRCLRLCLVFFAISTVHAQTFPSFGARDMLPAVTGDGATGDSFGARIARCNGELLVAAPGDQVPSPAAPNGLSAGSVYRFVKAGAQWRANGKFELPGTELSALFGISMVCDENELFIGATGVGIFGLVSDAGTVFRYRRTGTGWAFNGEVPGARPIVDARFGFSMALSAAHLLVGAPGESAVYLYQRNNGALSAPQKIQGIDFGITGGFGYDIALTAGEFAVSAPNEPMSTVVRIRLTQLTEISRVLGSVGLGTSLDYVDDRLWIGSPQALNSVGRIFVLDTVNNVIVQTLEAPASGGPVESFGESIEHSATQIAVSAISARTAGNDGEGVVHLYPRNSGQAVLSASIRPNIPINNARADAFGYGLAIDNFGIYVGAPYADAAGHPVQGRAFIFDISGQELASVDSGRGAAFDRFASALALSGDFAIAGAAVADTEAGVEAGEAYIYQRKRAGWRLVSTLRPPDASVEQRFGSAVDIDGDLAVVGAVWDPVAGLESAGSAYVYTRVGDQWQFLEKLISPQPREGALFGFAVAVSGNRIVVGARGESDVFSEQGAVVFFERAAPGARFRAGPVIRAPESGEFDSFGAFVDLKGDYALIAAPGTERPDGFGGRAYVMQNLSGQWQVIAALPDAQGQAEDGFAFSVALAENPLRAYVGTPFSSNANQDASVGHMVEFRPINDLWGPVRRTLSPIQLPGTQFGVALAAHGDGVIVGASGVDLGASTDAGAGFLVRSDGSVLRLDGPLSLRAAAGRSVASDGTDRALLGAPGHSTVNPLEGAAFEVLGEALFGDSFE